MTRTRRSQGLLLGPASRSGLDGAKRLCGPAVHSPCCSWPRAAARRVCRRGGVIASRESGLVLGCVRADGGSGSFEGKRLCSGPGGLRLGRQALPGLLERHLRGNARHLVGCCVRPRPRAPVRPEMVAGLEVGRRAVRGLGPGPPRPKLLVERRVLVREFVDGGLVVPGVLPARLPGARAERRSRAPAGWVWIGGKPPKPCTGLTH